MKLPPIITSLIAAILFSSCDSPSQAPEKEKAHQATATVQIFPSTSLPDSQNFLANQIAILKTGSLIKAAALSAGISPDTLSSSLAISPIEGTDLLAITAHHDDEALPKTIVQALTKAYLDHRQDLQTKATNPLDNELIAQNAIVKDLREDLTVLIQQYGIPRFDGTIPNPIKASEQEMLRNARQKIADFETQRDQLEHPIKKLSEIKEDDLVHYAAGLDLPDNQVTHYFTQHLEALEQKRTLLAQGKAASDPDIRALEKKAEGTMAYAQKESVTLKAVLRTKLELINRQLKRMNEMVNDHEENSRDLRKRQQKYTKAKETYEQARKVLRELEIKKQEAQLLLKQPHKLLIIHGWDHQ